MTDAPFQIQGDNIIWFTFGQVTSVVTGMNFNWVYKEGMEAMSHVDKFSFYRILLIQFRS